MALAAVFAALVLGLGISRPFSREQESLSAQYIVDVTHNGHWLIGRDFYGFLNRKPPLFTWFSAIVAGAAGGKTTEAGARAVSLAAALGAALVVLSWTGSQMGSAAAWLAFLFVLGSHGFASRAVFSSTDMLLSSLLFAAWCIAYPMFAAPARAVRAASEGAQLPDRPSVPYTRALWSGLLLGLAVLTKGPLALVLFALAAFIYLALVRRNPLGVLGQTWPWIILAAAVGVALLWYVPAILDQGKRLAAVIAAENLGHFLPAAAGGTGEAEQPFYYMSAKLIALALPLSVLFPALIAAIARGEVEPRARDPFLYQLGLAAAVLLFFSLGNTKRPDYIVPILPSLAVVFAALFTVCLQGRRTSWTPFLRDGAVVATTTIVAAGLAALWLTALRPEGARWLDVFGRSAGIDELSPLVRALGRFELPYVAFAAAAAAAAAMAWVAWSRRRALMMGAALALLGVSASALSNGALEPALAAKHTIKRFAARIHRRIGGAPLYIARGLRDFSEAGRIHESDDDLAFYYGRAIPPLRMAPLTGPAAEPPTIYLVATQRQLTHLRQLRYFRTRQLTCSHSESAGGHPCLYELDRLNASSAVKAPAGRPAGAQGS